MELPENRRFLAYFPKITPEEYAFVLPLIVRLSEQQAKEFLSLYSENRFDAQTYTLLSALGFIFTPGLQRFYVGEWALGILYMFTCGLFFIGTIVDLIQAKEKIGALNRTKAQAIFTNFGNPFQA
jgi:TM2 domain-containing membrane protein YozV